MALAGYDYASLLPYCRSESQRRTVEALVEHKTQRAAGKALGIAERNICGTIARIRKYAISRGWSPEHGWTKPAPEGYRVKGTTTLYDEDGRQRLQWVKTREDDDVLSLEAFANGLAAELPKYAPKAAPEPAQATSLCNLYVLTDYHLGMYAWAPEAGADWDTQIAERLLVDWYAAAIERAPKADVAVFAQLGDFLHWDGLESVTPSSGHVLDADTRFDKLVEVAARVLRRVTDMLLAKYPRVHSLMAEGNHDLASSVWLRRLLALVYENEPRVTVETRPDPYYCYEWGKTSLFFHHGHKRKPKDVDAVFASKFRDVFGRTQHSYAHMGHMHHDLVKETNLMRVEQHRTLAAPDAYASRGGWMSGRSADVITYHREHGEVGRIRITPELAQAA